MKWELGFSKLPGHLVEIILQLIIRSIDNGNFKLFSGNFELYSTAEIPILLQTLVVGVSASASVLGARVGGQRRSMTTEALYAGCAHDLCMAMQRCN